MHLTNIKQLCQEAFGEAFLVKKDSLLFIKVGSNNTYDFYSTIFCELLHKEIVEVRLSLMSDLLNSNITPSGLSGRIINHVEAFAPIIEESVVHAASQSWIGDNLERLGLSEDEKLQLVAFLKTLTDDEFINDERFKQD